MSYVSKNSGIQIWTSTNSILKDLRSLCVNNDTYELLVVICKDLLISIAQRFNVIFVNEIVLAVADEILR